eukprot:TRINITY_DN6733_c1_g1_i11.p1 TRINITY_DN6733_c1_g1~~TRINITY_DN6733_c1_g1_i11.p1  ORF type:complete len:480 (+),score=88.83 TRINITY_DN6733_c1_g1_i11:54-1493(+)
MSDSAQAREREWLHERGVPYLVDDMVKAILIDRPDDCDPMEYFLVFLENGGSGIPTDPASRGVELDYGGGGHGGGGGMMKAARGMKRSFTRQRKINWRYISRKLPAGRSTAEVRQRRELFRLFDPNGNGYLSLAEVDKGLRDIVQLDDVFDCKPAIIRAFNAAKNVHKGRSRLGPDFVTRSEFRLLCVYLRRYFELFVMFDRMDQNDDRRLGFGEFTDALPQLEKWGVHVYYPEAQFNQIDKNGGGMILFDEFADWAIQYSLDIEDDDDDPDDDFQNFGSNLSSMHMGQGGPPKRMKGHFTRGRTFDYNKLAEAMPSGRSRLEFARRDEMFRLFDPNGNGYLSLAEVDKGIRDILRLDDLFDAKPAIMRAFQASKNAHKGRSRLGADYVTRSEFRLLLEYLRRYFELFVMFDRVDEGDDRRINEQEFISAGHKLEAWGLTVADLPGEFKKVDKNGGGQILFQEFCDWALEKHLSESVPP